MAKRVLRVRHSTSLLADQFTGREGEFTGDLEKKEIRFHDGVTPGGFPALRADFNNMREEYKEAARVILEVPSVAEMDGAIEAHIEDKENPHDVTKAQVGLENVLNVVQLERDKNLADVPDKAAARTNLGVYSKSEVDSLLLILRKAVIPYAGSPDDLPPGWHLCNGENGTYDLRDRFIIGARSYNTTNQRWQTGVTGTTSTQGGSINGQTALDGAHVHTASTGAAGTHNHSGATANATLSAAQGSRHRHLEGGHHYSGAGTGTRVSRTGSRVTGGLNTDAYSFYTDYNDTGGSNPHRHSISSDGSHTHSVTVDNGGNHRHNFQFTPPYFALAFVQYIGV